MDSIDYQLRKINNQLNPLPLFIKAFVKLTLWAWAITIPCFVLYKLLGS